MEIGDKSGEGSTLNNMATAAHARGDYDTALDQYRQVMAEYPDAKAAQLCAIRVRQITRARIATRDGTDRDESQIR